MINNSTVSVIVPIYNQEKYLKKSIPSILNQVYTNIEVILVNDGSTDDSIKILKKYRNIDNRIKIINKKNGGLVSAIVEGVRHCEGDYLCFLDPDDYYGPNYLNNFMCEMTPDIDVVAMGFYNDNHGILDPFFLKENKTYDKEINRLRETFLIDKNVNGISNQIFISRWNKCYKTHLVKQFIHLFEQYRNISLGEDTIFTYLILRYAKKIKTLSVPNEYYYNIGNQSSMMKNSQIQDHINMSNKAYEALSNLLQEDGLKQDSAYALYYFLLDSLFNRILSSRFKVYRQLCKFFKKDELYHKSLKIISSTCSSFKTQIILKIKGSSLPETFFFINFIKKLKPLVKWCLLEPKQYIKDLLNKGFTSARRLALFRKRRTNAFNDLNKYLPLLEQRIYPFIQNSIGEVTDIDNCPIEKNIFIFWWDGFDNAPKIVKACLKSVKVNHKGYKIHEITKKTYKKFTSINEEIIKGFENGRISIQTFSDILRFNLLKNNGGVWIDATIYFAAEYDLISHLKNKSFESVVFSSSESFLTYEGLNCTWSGYYIASRKNGLLVSIMDSIFEQYYLKYKTYTIYFFIDAAFMICKKYKIDGAVLDKVLHDNNSMFLLSTILNANYDEKLLEQIKAIPQKLSWFESLENKAENSMYNVLINQE